MLKTGRLTILNRFRAMVLIMLAFLIFGLIVHALIADPSITFNPNISHASNLNELTDQDDLAQSHEIQPQTTPNIFEKILAAVFSIRVQALFDNFNPPKI